VSSRCCCHHIMTALTAISRLNFRMIGIISIALVLFSILFGFVFVPKFVRSHLRKVSVELLSGSLAGKLGDKKNFLCDIQIDFSYNYCLPFSLSLSLYARHSICLRFYARHLATNIGAGDRSPQSVGKGSVRANI
jgi:hypothetical protein